MRTIRCAALAALALLAARPAAAQEFPNRAIRAVIPAAAGGASDILARIVADAMAPAFPRGIVIEARPGAGGNIAADIVARSAPDGYTLLFGDVAIMAINPVIYRRVPYDPVADFAPVGMVGYFPFVITVHPSVPATTLREFIAWARAQREPVLYASPNAGSPHHLGGEILAQRAGIRLSHVPYRGGAPAIVDLLAGSITVGSIGLPPLVGHFQAGRLRGLGVSSAERSPAAPDVPTIAEAGLPGFDMTSWYALFAPRGTPAAAIRYLDAALLAAIDTPAVRQKFIAQGATAQRGSAEDLAGFMTAEIAKWGPIARASGASID